MTKPCTKRWNRLQRLCTDYIKLYEPAVYQLFKQQAEREFPPHGPEESRELARQACIRRWQREKGSNGIRQ